MNDKIQQYLNELGAPKALVERVEAAIQAFKFLCGSEPEQIFVSETIDDNTGDRRYGDIWGFLGHFWMMAKPMVWDVDPSVCVAPAPHGATCCELGLGCPAFEVRARKPVTALLLQRHAGHGSRSLKTPVSGSDHHYQQSPCRCHNRRASRRPNHRGLQPCPTPAQT